VLEVSDAQFTQFIAESIDELFDQLPEQHAQAIQNVAITYEDEPTSEQRVQLELRNDESLFGLYEGIPLSKRQGMTSYGPDKITIFKLPMLHFVTDLNQLKVQVKHTLWHELGHYFGLDHDAIHAIEHKWQ
jgi:predicted Zn-dependent protease with MMP-like domain